MAHSEEVLAAFQGGEVRLIYARHKASEDLFYMPENDADIYRDFTREHLRCLIGDCPQPRLKAVHRANRRDGFSHFSGAGGHAPESLFHIQASEHIAVWLRAKYPHCRVQKEERSNSAGERRADVMITSPAGGRVAFEIQYAALAPGAWQIRHDSYKAQGIQDVWLFGHHGAQHRPDHGPGGRVLLNPTHEAVVRAGLPLLWVNPFTDQIGTATSTAFVGGAIKDVPAAAGAGVLAIDVLSEFRLGGIGLTSDRLERLANTRDQAAALEAARERAVAERRAEAERIAETKRLAAEARAASMAALRPLVKDAAQALMPDWLASDLREKLLAKHGGRWPAHLDVRTARDPGMPVPWQQWQAILYCEFIDGRPVGFPVIPWKCADTLDLPLLNRNEATYIIREWLDALGRLGRVHVNRTEDHSGRVSSTYTVMSPADLARVPDGEVLPNLTWSERQEIAREERLTTVQLAADAAAANAREASRRKAETAGKARAAGTRTAQEQLTNPPCDVCKKPLYDIYLEQGRHGVCQDGWRA